MKQSESTESFAEYIRRNQNKNRSTAVYVEGDLRTEPPTGRGTAKAVADKLNNDSREIVRMAPGDVTEEDRQQPDSVGTILVTLGPDTAKDTWTLVQQRLLSRVPRDTDVVVLVDSDDVPWFVKQLCDVRVVPNGPGGETRSYRVKMNAWDGDVYYTEISYSDGDAA